MSVSNAQDTINTRLLSWADVSAAPHHRGPKGVAWFVGRIEIGHIHGDSVVDIAFPPKVRDELIAAGRAQPHHMFPEVGITFTIESAEDVEKAIELLRLSYDLISERRKRHTTHRTGGADDEN